MRTVSDDYKAVSNASRLNHKQFYTEIKVVDNTTTTTITMENIATAKTYADMFEKCSIGNVVSRKLELGLWNAAVSIGDSLTLWARIGNGTDTSEWLAKGTFAVASVDANDSIDGYDIVAYDVLSKSDSAYTTAHTGTQLISTIVSDIATELGITVCSETATYLAGFTTYYGNAELWQTNAYTRRTILKYIATMTGCNVEVNDLNELKFIPVTHKVPSTAILLRPVECDSFKRGEEQMSYNRVKLWISSSSFVRYPVSDADWDAAGGYILEGECPDATAAMAEAIYNQVREFYPTDSGTFNYQREFSVNEWFYEPKFELGDSIYVNESSSNYGLTNIASLEITWGKLTVADVLYSFETDQENSVYTEKEVMPSDTTSAVTRSSGATLDAQYTMVRNNLCCIKLELTKTSSTSSGGTIFTGTIADSFKPPYNVVGYSYYSGHSIGGMLKTDGTITIKNESSSAVTISDGINFCFFPYPLS